jgi:hypothetical protein
MINSSAETAATQDHEMAITGRTPHKSRVARVSTVGKATGLKRKRIDFLLERDDQWQTQPREIGIHD